MHQRGEALAELATRLHDEQQERERRAVLVERVAIAREPHDVVAHHMSVIAVQSGLAHYVFSSDPALARQARGAVSQTSGDALDEVRRLVTILRPERLGEDGGVASGPEEEHLRAPGVDRLAALIQRVGLAGVQAELATSGTPVQLPSGLGLCVYRVVQESLTNVIRHANARHVTVSLRYLPHQLTVHVIDDGDGATRNEAGTGGDGSERGGHGLLGMRERARLYGGTFCAHRRSAGGFEVSLTFPLPSQVRPAGPSPVTR